MQQPLTVGESVPVLLGNFSKVEDVVSLQSFLIFFGLENRYSNISSMLETIFMAGHGEYSAEQQQV